MITLKPNALGQFDRLFTDNEMLHVSLGNGSMFRIILNTIDGYLWVSVVGKGCYGFARSAHFSYVDSKLNIGNENDAKHLADFINDQLYSDYNTQERQGTYCEPSFN